MFFRSFVLACSIAESRAAETLMVGDREDNDFLPAGTVGWRVWQFSQRSENANRGNWEVSGPLPLRAQMVRPDESCSEKSELLLRNSETRPHRRKAETPVCRLKIQRIQ